MLFTVTILVIECFGILMFIFGYIAGRQFEKADHRRAVKLQSTEESLDPVTPEDQMLISMLDEEARRHGQR